VFSLHISRKMSGTCGAAMRAEEAFDGVYVYDTETVAGTMSLLAERLRARLEPGCSLDEARAYVVSFIEGSHLLIHAATLEYLRRGGRIGRAASLVGDEPLLIARATAAKVRVDRDRVAAARALVAAGCDIVVCDDGLQHYRLARDIEIEVQDARRRYGNGRLLPAGPLREPLERAADCGFRVLNLGVAGEGVAERPPGLGEWPMRLQVGAVQHLHGGRPQPLAMFAGQRVHAVAGIGDTERFFAMLRDAGIAVVPHAFPDHHAYAAPDFDFGSRLPVLMTAKDAVKCAGLVDAQAFMVPVEAVLPEPFWLALLDRLPARSR